MDTTDMTNTTQTEEKSQALRMQSEVEEFGAHCHLSPREKEIVLLLVNGYVATEAIARKLGISIFTVKNHLQNIFQKTSTKSKSQILSRFINECCGAEQREVETKRYDRPLVMLLADENFRFQGLIQKASEKAGGIPSNLVFVNEGSELFDYLERTEKADTGQDRPRYLRPDVIMLDLDMPRLNGAEALERIKKSERYKDIPVIAITESDVPEEVKKVSFVGGHSYFVKASEADDLVDTMASIITYWSDLASLPEMRLEEAH